jgi:DNA-directed RNA polymerase specialized sigma24 family protein
MTTNNQELAEYFSLIKKLTNYVIKDQGHASIKEDIAQEAFLKLLKQDFFDKYDWNADIKIITVYMKKTIHSCYMDQLKVLGFNRPLSKREKEVTGNRYENIIYNQFDEVSEADEALHIQESSEETVFAKQAYPWIKKCYDSLSLGVSDLSRRKFFEAAFWDFGDYDLPMNKLANHLGYESSNPTQELSRFIKKISMCTEPHGITINNAHEQIQFLQEQIDSSGVDS